jgi:hypothetical protein
MWHVAHVSSNSLAVRASASPSSAIGRRSGATEVFAAEAFEFVAQQS